MRVGKQLLVAKKPNREKAERWPKQESTYYFSRDSDERDVVVEDDDDG
jgi:hypothetical protein